MRLDQQLNAAALGINARQQFFLSAWFNLVHQYSLDSYRVRVMNPLNILRELRRMFDPPASDDDRKVVALEAGGEPEHGVEPAARVAHGAAGAGGAFEARWTAQGWRLSYFNASRSVFSGCKP